MSFLKRKNKAHYIKINDKKAEKTLALHFSAGLGDYLMFRSFLKDIRAFYKDYHITLIGDIAFKDFALIFDKQYFDELIYFSQNIGFNAYAMDNRSFDILISCFNDFSLNTALNCGCIKAKEKIVLIQGSRDIGLVFREYLINKYFTKAIYLKDGLRHQCLNYKYFFEKLFNQNLSLSLNLKLDEHKFKQIHFDFNQKYAVIFAGSNDKVKRWDYINFNLVCKHLYEKYKIISFIAGSKNESSLATKITQNQAYIKNICGQFSLEELVYILKKAKFVLANDTGGYHLAMSASENIICVSNGASFKGCVSYPKELCDNKIISTPLPQKALENEMSEYWRFDKDLLQSISADEVCKIIDEKHSKYF